MTKQSIQFDHLAEARYRQAEAERRAEQVIAIARSLAHGGTRISRTAQAAVRNRGLTLVLA
jgi:hypothetical protein